MAANLLDPAPMGQAVFVFAGPSVDEDMGDSANLLGSDYEDNFVAGIGYQHLPFNWGDFWLGGEIGAAGRFGDNTTGEFWGGAVARYDVTLFDAVRVAPAFTFGLSAITDTMSGRETSLEEEYDGDASLLFYLGPEINLGLASHPEMEVFWRLHHRSGANGTLGDMRGAANANVFGLRYRF